MTIPKESDLVAGKRYLTLICANAECKMIIPIARAGKLRPRYRHKLNVCCPFCGKSSEYSLDDAENRTLEIMPPSVQ
jgi:hypothetical protein